jgi:Zn-dependent protease/CBS domain-containing protein
VIPVERDLDATRRSTHALLVEVAVRRTAVRHVTRIDDGELHDASTNCTREAGTPHAPHRAVFRRGSITLLTVKGVPIRAHWTLLIILPYLAIAYATRLGTSWLAGLAIAIGLFISVALHELAHTSVAMAAGGRVKDITLMLLGGVSQISRMPDRRGIEALVAAVGPIASIVLGLLLMLMKNPYVFLVGEMNIAIGVFNLLPAFPLDGGRVLRSLLALRVGAPRATRFAATFGKVAAAALAAWGIVSGAWLLVFVAVFLFIGAEAEVGVQRVHDALAGVKVRDVMTSSPPTIGGWQTVSRAVVQMRAAGRPELVVVDAEAAPVGIVRAADLAAVPFPHRDDLHVVDLGETITRHAIVVAPDETAADALDRAAETGAEYLVASDDETKTVLGLVGKPELERALAVQSLPDSRAGLPSRS